MSVQAMAWALKQQVETHPEARHVLLCLANYASADGTSAFPSIATLVSDTGLSESTVRRNLHRLLATGLIEKDSQAIVAARIERADRRPVCYRIVIQTRGVPLTPRAEHGVSDTSPRGVRGASTGCQALTPDPSLIRQKEILTDKDLFASQNKTLRGPHVESINSIRERMKKKT